MTKIDGNEPIIMPFFEPAFRKTSNNNDNSHSRMIFIFFR